MARKPVNIEVDMRKFDKAIKAASDASGKALPELVREGARAFTAAAIRLTPPDRNRSSIRQRPFRGKRGEKMSWYERPVHLSIFRYRNGAPEWIRATDQTALETGDQLRAKISRTVAPKWWETKHFDPVKEAASGTSVRSILKKEPAFSDNLRQIHFRGIARAGWWLNLPEIGGKIPQSTVSERNFETLLRMGKVANVDIRKDLFQYALWVENRVRGIQRMLNDFLLARAFRTAAGRMRYLSRSAQKKIEKAAEVPF